jgi:hypothetical protein
MKEIKEVIGLLKNFETDQNKDYEKYANYINLIYTGLINAKYIPVDNKKSLVDIIKETEKTK